MKRTEGNILDFLRIVVTTMLFLVFIAGTASAFNFQGYAYDETKGGLNGTNASIEVYSFGPQGPQLQTTHSNLSNTSGYFNVSGVTDNPLYFYKIVLRHFNATNNTIDYIGQSLPEFPYPQILQLTMGSPIDFYLRPGGTINISAVNVTGAVTTFRYQIKDTRLGYPIASNFNSEISNALVYVPANRSYSIMIYPNQSFPVSYDLNNLTTYTDNYANISFNTSNLLRRVTGYANLSNGSSNFTNLNIIAYLMEPGSMIFQDHPMPYNMSAWNCDGGDCQSDIYDPANGTFNITLPGAQMTANILLFATANQGENYYGAFRNISLDYSNTSVPNFNFTLETLLGTTTIIQLNNASGGPGGPPGTTNITTKKLSFRLKNESSGNNISGFAHVEVKVNYSAYNGSTFNWMTDVSQASNGSFSIPVINADINKINIFTQDFAPLKTSKTSAQLATEPVVINLTSFEPGAINRSGPPPDIKIKMLKSNPQCDVPQPAPGCNLFNDAGGEKNMADFNPFKVVIGGGKISMRMKLVSNNITVHYKNVDMLASGPPDAVFDPSANQTSQNGTLLEQVWRFGSMGPEIYDEVLIGIPLGSVNPNNVSVKLGKLYDNSWNEAWNMSVNDTSQIPSDYSAFNTTWFNNATGMPCTTNITSPCYLDLTRRMVWLTIPHFSGVGPTVSGTAGNFTANLTNSTGIAGRNVAMNFTMNDTVNTTSWYNITFPDGFDASAAIVNISINGSADPLDWEKTNGTLFVNVSSSTGLANISEVQYINISNITLPGSTGIKTINVTTSNELIVTLNYTVATYGVNLSVSGIATGTTNATVNKTYTLLLQNNGSATDTYNLTVNSTNASTAALNVSENITLGSMETRTILLSVTNAAEGTAYVNVTARSLNDSTRAGSINTITTITAAPVRNVILTIDPVSAAASTRPAINATYTINLTNTGNMVDSYTLVLDGDTTASVNATNITSINDLAAGASRIFLLNVTNTTQGVFHINLTATSSDLITNASVNTTTSVILDQPDVAASYWGYVAINGVLSSGYISVHGSNGAEVANTTSASNGTYQVAVPWDDIYTPADEGVVSGETITFNVNNISVLSRTIAVVNSGNNTRLDLGLYNGTIIGSVLKASTGLGIDGATVTITNATLGLSVTTTTDPLGSYSAPVFPATYSINVTKTGYLSNNTTTGKIVTANTSTPVPAILLSPNTVTVTANRTVGSANAGQKVTFNLTVVNTGDNATFTVVTSPANDTTTVTNTTTPSPLLLNTITSTGNVIVEVNNSNLGGWPVTVIISNGTQSKTARITLNAIMRNSSVANTTINSTVNNSNVTGGAYLENTTVDNATVANATLIDATVRDNATISGNSTLITNSTITGPGTTITDGSVITGTYADSNIDNSTIGNATVDSSNLTRSTISDNASITNSTLTGATVANSTLTNVTVSGESSITNVAGLDNITMGGVTIIGQAAYDYEGMISATTTGWVTYQTINFTTVYEAVRISQLVIEQSGDIIIPANISTAINVTRGVSRNISMNVTASRSMDINVSETLISPDGVGLGSGKIGNYLVIRSNDTNASNVTNHTLRLYLDVNPANYTGGVKIYYFNTTAATPAWEALTTTASGNESGRWYLEAAPNHFSTFALLGTTTPTTTPCSSCGGGGDSGSGGGGGGGKSAENVSNIEVIEKYDLQISKDALTSYRFTDKKNPIMYVNITGNTTLGIITASVEVLKNTSTLVSFPPEGLVYKNANIWVGTTGFATSKNIKDALIKFRVANSWMSENRVQNSAMVLEKWDGSNWIQLETKFVSKDDTYSYFEGRTNSFSPFAIVAKAGGAQPTATVTSTPAGTPTPGSTAKPGGDAGGIPSWIIGLIILVIIGAAAYYFLVVKKNE
ncbi:MAG: PGF-pre-PGF domain-containing protein [Candidatus Methanoperedens sp.]|nr:PGF-pre-PGF domain-containing protein [Candidatus Methanoperedens sp. BLZ2]MBZ0174572.1 PGF-pre-PGF domain-containing protein [Candidatus Methanoperedens nitroreducens]MCX9078597.1 PGF-pre-PGF domain-containing protein [Candidatus Methanoperedens sp.]